MLFSVGAVGAELCQHFRFQLVPSDVMGAALFVMHGSQNVTESIPAARFQWKRKSADSTADAIWNDAHTGMKSILLTTRDVLYSATYDCELLKK